MLKQLLLRPTINWDEPVIAHHWASMRPTYAPCTQNILHDVCRVQYVITVGGFYVHRNGHRSINKQPTNKTRPRLDENITVNYLHTHSTWASKANKMSVANMYNNHMSTPSRPPQTQANHIIYR